MAEDLFISVLRFIILTPLATIVFQIACRWCKVPVPDYWPALKIFTAAFLAIILFNKLAKYLLLVAFKNTNATIDNDALLGSVILFAIGFNLCMDALIGTITFKYLLNLKWEKALVLCLATLFLVPLVHFMVWVLLFPKQPLIM